MVYIKLPTLIWGKVFAKVMNFHLQKTKQNAKIKSDKVLNKAIINPVVDNIEIFKQFNDNQCFKNMVFRYGV